jgi:hypothetical protein
MSSRNAIPKIQAPVRRRRRARPGQWEEAYFEAMRLGHTKASAAGLAGVSERAVYNRAKTDAEFAEAAEIAYHCGTGELMKIAYERITDRAPGSDRLLIHLLSARGVTAKKVAPEPQPARTASDIGCPTITADQLSTETKRRLLAEIEALKDLDAELPS